MPEEYKIVLTSALTILGGIIIFVTGQVLVKFVIEPLHDQSKLIGEIAASLIFYANAGITFSPQYAQQMKTVTNDENIDETTRKLQIERYQELIRNELDRSEEASKTLRQQASRLLGTTQAIPAYWMWTLLGRPSYRKIVKASSGLIGLSNSDNKGDYKRVVEIAKCLNLKLILIQQGVK